jgi:hypothetical protein
MTEVHRFHSLFAAQAFIATLRAAQKSYRSAKIPRPKPGKPLYTVVVYG